MCTDLGRRRHGAPSSPCPPIGSTTTSSLSRSKSSSPPDQLAPTPGVPSLPFTHQPFAGDTDRFDGIRTMSTGFFEASKTMEPALKKRDTGELRVRDCTRIASRLGNQSHDSAQPRKPSFCDQVMCHPPLAMHSRPPVRRPTGHRPCLHPPPARHAFPESESCPFPIHYRVNTCK